MTRSDILRLIAPWLTWWSSGWKEAWAMLPKPAFLATPALILLRTDGQILKFQRGKWGSASKESTAAGVLLEDKDVLLRNLHLPLLAQADLLSSIDIEIAASSPFAPEETCRGYNIEYSDDGQLLVEIGICHKKHAQPTSTVFAHGSLGPIRMFCPPMQPPPPAWRQSVFTRGLMITTLVLVLLFVISPTLMLRTEAQGYEEAMRKLSTEAKAVMSQREELGRIHEHLDMAHTFAERHPDLLPLLEQISQSIPDQAWVEKITLRKGVLSIHGRADNAIAIVASLQAAPGLRDVHLGASVDRDPRSGKEMFQIDAQIGDGQHP
ncbi:MAG: PilN domain-containing protein [Pseudomonadota bacterium]